MNPVTSADVAAGFGAAVGSSVGFGAAVGLSVGFGAAVGLSVGFGAAVGLSVGFGAAVGLSVGLGATVGLSVGFGTAVGSSVGFGTAVGSSVGSGATVGSFVGSSVGTGVSVGFGVGVGVAPQPLNSKDVRTRLKVRKKINVYCPNCAFFMSFLLLILERDDLTTIRSDRLSVPSWAIIPYSMEKWQLRGARQCVDQPNQDGAD